jgi:heat shock protein HslJ
MIIMTLSCKSGGSVKEWATTGNDGGVVFLKDIQGKEWILDEVKSVSGTVRMDRQKLEADGIGGVYTITFDAEQVSGMGAPNRFHGPYTRSEGKTLSFGKMASTLMAAIKDPEGLKEYEYYAYLDSVSRWDLKDGKLELHTKDRSNAEAVLIFSPNQ